MAGPKLLVTGGTGFVGSTIVNLLHERHPEYDITITDIKEPSPIWPLKGDFPFFQADLTDLKAAEDTVAQTRPDVLVHTAGAVPERDLRYSQRARESTFKINVGATKNLLEAAKLYGVKIFIYTSSECVVIDDMYHDYPNVVETEPLGNATLVYGQSKAEAETLVLAANSEKMQTCALRPSVICGPGDTQLVPTIHACIAKFETPFIVGSGQNLFDFTYVGNVAHGHVLAVENLLSSKTAAGEAFFISNGEPIPFRAFMVSVWQNFGHVPPFQVHIPTSLAWFAGLMAECVTWFTGGETTLSRGSVRDAVGHRYCSIEKARRVLGYEPVVGLEEGLRISCEVSVEHSSSLEQQISKSWSARMN